MLTASDFELALIQAVAFTPDMVTFPQSRILAEFIQEYSALYDGPVTSLPLPLDSPPPIPRIMLQSGDGAWRLQIGPARIDAIWTAQLGSLATLSAAEIVARSSEVLKYYIRQHGPRAGRLALVLQRGCLAPHPSQALVERFCTGDAQQSVFRQSVSFEIHNQKRYQLPSIGREINSWVRCRTALLNGEPAVAVEQDINTLEEEAGTGNFSFDDISGFFTNALSEADSILRLYFPGE